LAKNGLNSPSGDLFGRHLKCCARKIAANAVGDLGLSLAIVTSRVVAGNGLAGSAELDPAAQ
jgi:hypothetical protein